MQRSQEVSVYRNCTRIKCEKSDAQQIPEDQGKINELFLAWDEQKKDSTIADAVISKYLIKLI